MAGRYGTIERPSQQRSGTGTDPAARWLGLRGSIDERTLRGPVSDHVVLQQLHRVRHYDALEGSMTQQTPSPHRTALCGCDLWLWLWLLPFAQSCLLCLLQQTVGLAPVARLSLM